MFHLLGWWLELGGMGRFNSVWAAFLRRYLLPACSGPPSHHRPATSNHIPHAPPFNPNCRCLARTRRRASSPLRKWTCPPLSWRTSSGASTPSPPLCRCVLPVLPCLSCLRWFRLACAVLPVGCKYTKPTPLQARRCVCACLPAACASGGVCMLAAVLLLPVQGCGAPLLATSQLAPPS